MIKNFKTVRAKHSLTKLGARLTLGLVTTQVYAHEPAWPIIWHHFGGRGEGTHSRSSS